MFDKEKYKALALQILSPISPIDENTKADGNLMFEAQRSDASYKLKEYYLVYFLFADLLGFQKMGKFEKVAWSFPIDYKGKAFLIEYRKMGIGVFVQDIDTDQMDAEEIVIRINKAIGKIKPFFNHLAQEAVLNSTFNIVNNNRQLYDRFEFLLSLYKAERKKTLKKKGKYKVTQEKTEEFESILYESLYGPHYQRSNWLAISCIEAFFSWTEHLFIHLAVINSSLSDGQEVAKLIEAEWKVKFKAAINDQGKDTTRFYNELITIRQQVRNFVAHGAFGKDGNAFFFHSKTGTVPVLMGHNKQRNKFSLYGELTFNEEEVIKLIEEFIKYLWNGDLGPALLYTQEYGMPTILTYAANGVYEKAIQDIDSMREFCDWMGMEMDNAANMDW